MAEYVEIANLPAAVQSALKSVGYGKKDIRTEASETVSLSGSPGDGFKSFVCLVNLATGQFETHWGSWGGANMFDRSNVVDNDTNSYPLPANGVAIRGTKGGSQPVYAALHIPAAMVSRMLPAPVAELSTDENNALYCHNSVTGGKYRKDELARLRVPASVIDALVSSGMLSRNKAGSVSITTAGKNAVADYRPSYRI
jgi:hypothetical protein